ncbi:hypothetical protein IJ095_03465, partial [Candidatus Saccharibacteria bacterium]|nr:hypothetical protein [Candidatus Saccharibacteria bacterium]
AEAHAETTSASVDWSSVQITLNTNDTGSDGTSGDVEFSTLSPTANNLDSSGSSYGTLKVLKKNISIATNGKYYTIYLSTNTTNNSLNLVTSGSGASATTTTGVNIPAIGGTWASPMTFTANGRAGWGFAVPGTMIAKSTSDATPPTFVVPSLTDTQITSETDTTGAAATYTSTVWSAVPVLASPQQIWKATTSNALGFGTYTSESTGQEVTGDTTNNHFDIYYAVAVDTDTLAGTYQNTLVYTAMASTDSLDAVSSNLARDHELVASGDTLSITFDLADSTATSTIASSDILVTLIPHSALYDSTLNSNAGGFDYDKTATELAALTGTLPCPVASASLATGSGNNLSTVTCTLPDHDPEDGSGNASYDIWLHIDKYNYNYLSHYTYAYNSTTYDVAAVTYAGLQSYWPNDGTTYGSTASVYTDPRFTENTDTVNSTKAQVLAAAGAYTPAHIINYMQEMTASVCKMTNKWNNQTATNARIMNYSGTTQLVTDGATEADTLAANVALNTGTFALVDSRDNNDYLVRHFADDNCWMVQNLDLDLSTVGTLTPADSDVSSDWDPYATSGSSQTDTTIFASFSLTQLADSQPTQYQNSTQYSTQGSIKWHWGSRYDENGNDIATASDPAATSDATCQANTTSTYSSGAANATASYQSGQGGCIENNSRGQIPRSYNNTIYSGETTDGTGTRGAMTAVRYVPTNGLTGATTSYGTNANTATTSARTSTTWDSANNTFYGNEYIGKYYNWYAATAESGLYTMSETISAGHADDQASDSICPKGWSLPYDYDYVAGRSQSWRTLLFSTYKRMDDGTTALASNSESSLSMRSAPLSIPFTGYYNWAGAGLYYRGSNGYFWSRTASSQPDARYLRFNGTNVYPQSNYSKVYGFTVRCVAQL